MIKRLYESQSFEQGRQVIGQVVMHGMLAAAKALGIQNAQRNGILRGTRSIRTHIGRYAGDLTTFLHMQIWMAVAFIPYAVAQTY